MSEYNIEKCIVMASNHLICDKSYVEKDYYTTAIIHALAARSFFGHSLIFSGGTSLSKGYGIINRFSEDVDFIIQDTTNISRNTKKDIKHCVIEEILKIKGLKYKSDSSAKEDCKVSIEVSYKNLYKYTKAIRSNILVELFFENSTVVANYCNIESYLCKYGKYSGYTRPVMCRDVCETLSDKFSALLWRSTSTRIPDRLTRHLYDIHYLYNYMKNNNIFDVNKFKFMVNFQYINKDSLRCSYQNITDAIHQALETLSRNQRFQTDYDNYVLSMIFGTGSQNISFSETLATYRELAELVVGNHNVTSTK